MVKVRSRDESNYKRIRNIIKAWLEGKQTDSWLIGLLRNENSQVIKRAISEIEPNFQTVEKGRRTIQNLKELLQIH
jgi:hypothetical protein